MSIKSALTRVRKWVVATVAAIAAAVAAFFGFDVGAQAVPVVDNLSWEAPTQFTDGSAIPPGTITGYRIVWGPAPTGTWPAANTQDVGAVLARSLTRPETFGNRCYKVAALVGTANGEWSGPACKNVQAPANAPGNLRVQ